MLHRNFAWKSLWEEKAKETNPFAASGRTHIRPEEFSAIVSDVKEKLELRPEDTLLEIGCGNGLLLKHLGPCVRRAVGVDFCATMLTKARLETTGLSNLEFLFGEATRLPMNGTRFSRILCYSVWHHLESLTEVKECLREIKRCGEEGGIALIGDLPHKNWRKAYLDGIWNLPFPDEKKQQMFEINSRALWFSPDEILRLVSSLGMSGRVLAHDESMPYARLMGRFDIRLVL